MNSKILANLKNSKISDKNLRASKNNTVRCEKKVTVASLRNKDTKLTITTTETSCKLSESKDTEI